MPVPSPTKGESQDDFIGRCMGDDTMQEYDQKQRAAVCFSNWRKSKKAEGGMPTQTARLSHEDIRGRLWRALDEQYAGKDAQGMVTGWPSIIEVYDGFVVAKMQVDGAWGLYRQEYQVTGQDDLELTGQPIALTATGNGVAGHVALRANAILTGADASQLLATLKDSNPLFAALKDSPNTHLVVFDLTSVGKPSQHAGPVRYQLAKEGLAKALPTLISKPIHVTDEFDGHVMAGKDPKPIGAFLGGVGLDNPDGSVTLRAIGTLWDLDFPETIEEIRKNAASLGASYEISYLAASANRLSESLMEIGQYEFAGGAILHRSAAAHPETQVLLASKDPTRVFDVMDDATVAPLLAYLRGATSFTQAKQLTYQERSNLKDSDFALVQTVDDRKVRRFPIQDETHRKNAWARLPQAKNLSDAERATVASKIMSRAKSAGDEWVKGYTKKNGKWVKTNTGRASMSFPGIPEEHEALVEALVTKAGLEAQKQAETAQAGLKAAQDEIAAMKKTMGEDAEKAKAQASTLVAAETKVTELTTALEAKGKEHAAAAEALGKIEFGQKLDAAWKKLQADYNLPDELRDKRKPLLEKQVAGKEPLTLDEIKELTSGGRSLESMRGTLYAGVDGAPAQIDEKQVAANFPGIKPRFR
jgi:hypothetical protein